MMNAIMDALHYNFACANCGDCHDEIPSTVKSAWGSVGDLCYCGCKEWKQGERIDRDGKT